MNTGIYPQALTPYARVFEFTLRTKPADAQGTAGSYVWRVPADCSLVEFFIVGAGGGGGGGGRYATTSARYGGGAGAAGSTTYFTAPAYFFTSPLTITIGAGGAGGAGATANTTAGSAGGSGAQSTISMLGAIFAAATPGAGPASGGSNSTAEGSSPGAFAVSGPRTYTIPSSASGGNTTTVGARSGPIPPNGSAGGYCPANGSYVAGGSVSVFGFSGLFDTATQKIAISTYKSGGDGAANAVGGNGFDGVIYGSGGGGGAASDNGFNAGSGGNGASGYVRITCY